MFSARWSPKQAAISPSPRRIVPVGIRPGGRRPCDGIPGGHNDPSGNGQPQHPSPKALADVFGAEMAAEVWDRFTVHYTPTHGSWLNQAEIEIGIFSRQCLGSRRIPNLKTLRQESKSLEPPHEPRPHQDQLEVRPQIRPSQVRLQKEIFQAVKDLADGAVVLTHSASSTVMEALAFAHRQGKALRVLAAESNAGGEGRAVVIELSRAGVPRRVDQRSRVAISHSRTPIWRSRGADWISLSAVTNKVEPARCACCAGFVKTGDCLVASQDAPVRTAARSHGPVRASSD